MLTLKQIYEIARRDNSLTRAMQQSWLMLEQTRAMFRDAVEILREEAPPARRARIYEEDRQVNQHQQEIRRRVFRHLTVTGGINLKAGLILTSIVIDIERIGDYTKNIVDLTEAHPAKLDSGRFDAEIRRIEAAVMALFDGTVGALRSGDADAARTLIREHLWLKRRCDDIARDLAGTPDERPPDAVRTALYARYLKRIGAHLMNILSSIVNPFDRIGYREERADAAKARERRPDT